MNQISGGFRDGFNDPPPGFGSGVQPETKSRLPLPIRIVAGIFGFIFRAIGAAIDLVLKLLLTTLLLAVLGALIVVILLVMNPDSIPQFKKRVNGIVQTISGLDEAELKQKTDTLISGVAEKLPEGIKNSVMDDLGVGDSEATQTDRTGSKTSQIRPELGATEMADFIASVMIGTDLEPSQREKLAILIVERSRLNGVDPLLTAAVIMRDSHFLADTISADGSKGLIGLTNEAAIYTAQIEGFKWMGADALTNPVYNLKLGTAYLKQLEREVSANPQTMLVAKAVGITQYKDLVKAGKQSPETALVYAQQVARVYANWKARLNE